MKTLARVSLSPAPLIYTSDLNSPANSASQGADMKSVKTHKEAENAANKTSEGPQEEARVEDITFTNTNFDVLQIVENINNEKALEGDVPNITQNKTTSSDITSMKTQDIVYAVSPPSPSQHENEYEFVEDIIREEVPSECPDEQLQKTPIAANKHARRGSKGVRGKIKKLFERFSCCLPTRSREYTTSR